jgi:hypothetical protein
LATIQKLGQQRASRVPALRAQIMAIQHIEGVVERTLPATARMRSKSDARSSIMRKGGCDP